MFKYHLALEAIVQTSIMFSHKVGCVLLCFGVSSNEVW